MSHLRNKVFGQPVESAQYTSIRFTETVALAGLVASIGSVGDAYDNAAAETVMGLFKNEAMQTGSPFRPGALRGLPDVEAVTFAWVDWYNTSRLHSTLADRIRGQLLRSRNRPASRRSYRQRSGMKTGTVQTATSKPITGSRLHKQLDTLCAPCEHQTNAPTRRYRLALFGRGQQRSPEPPAQPASPAAVASPPSPARRLTLMGIVVRDGSVDFDSFFQASLEALQEASEAFGGINSSIQAAPTGASNRFIIVFENASVLRFFWNAGRGMPPTIMWTFEDDSAPDDESIDLFFSRVTGAVQRQVPGLSFSRQRSLDDGNLTKGN